MKFTWLRREKGEVRIENHSYSLSMSRMDNGMLNNVSTKNIYLGGMRFFFFFLLKGLEYKDLLNHIPFFDC